MSGIIAQNAGRYTGLVKSASAAGVWNLIETLTASSSATLDFTSGIDDTYDEYVFKFHNIHPSADNPSFSFQGNVAGGSGYNETITSTGFDAYHEEGDTTNFAYNTGEDQGQGTALQVLAENIRSDADSHASGFLRLFDPSSTVFQKNFMARSVNMHDNLAARDTFIAGYINTTSAIDEIQFKMSTGNIDAGTISLYGIS